MLVTSRNLHHVTLGSVVSQLVRGCLKRLSFRNRIVDIDHTTAHQDSDDEDGFRRKTDGRNIQLAIIRKGIHINLQTFIRAKWLFTSVNHSLSSIGQLGNECAPRSSSVFNQK